MGCFTIILMLLGGFFFGLGTTTSTSTPPVQSSLDLTRYAEIPQFRTTDGAFSLGYDDAPVTIIIFEDFFCPHCQALHPTVDRIIEEYVAVGAATYEFRFFATAGGEQLNEVARLLECVDNQRPGAFWEGYLLTYDLTMQQRFPANGAALYAEHLDLNERALNRCTATAEQYLNDYYQAMALGVGGTPGIYLQYSDGTIIAYNGSRTFEDFASVIEASKYGSPSDLESQA